MSLYKGLKKFAIILALFVVGVLSFIVEDITGWGTGEIGGAIDCFGLLRGLLLVGIISLIIYWGVKRFYNSKSENNS